MTGLGSVRTVTDASGNMVNTYDYTPFGGIYANNTTENITNRYQYTGREQNPVSDTMYYCYRTYAPGAGRFISRDPSGYPNNIDGNLYVYCYNRATSWYDPDGLGGSYAGLDSIQGLGNYLGRGIENAVVGVIDSAGDAISAIGDGIGSAIDTVGDGVSDIIDAVTGAISTTGSASGALALNQISFTADSDGCSYFCWGVTTDIISGGVGAGIVAGGQSPISVSLGEMIRVAGGAGGGNVGAGVSVGVGVPNLIGLPLNASVDLVCFNLNETDQNGCPCPEGGGLFH